MAFAVPARAEPGGQAPGAASIVMCMPQMSSSPRVDPCEAQRGEAFAVAVRGLDELDRGVVQRELAVVGDVELQQIRPAGGEPCRIVGLDDRRCDPFNLVGLPRPLPVVTGRFPWPGVHVLAADLLVDLEERTPGVGGVELEDVVLLAVLGEGEAHAELVAQASLACCMIVTALQDHHVAAVALAAVEVAAGGGALLDGRDHLDELVAHWHDRVVQPEHADARIVEGDLHTELGAGTGRRRRRGQWRRGRSGGDEASGDPRARSPVSP